MDYKARREVTVDGVRIQKCVCLFRFYELTTQPIVTKLYTQITSDINVSHFFNCTTQTAGEN